MTFAELSDAIETASRLECDRIEMRVRVSEAVAMIRLDLALARIRTGCRISWDREYRVHDETGRVVMLTSDPSKALNVYQFRCSIAHQTREIAESGRDCLGLTPAIARW